MHTCSFAVIGCGGLCFWVLFLGGDFCLFPLYPNYSKGSCRMSYKRTFYHSDSELQAVRHLEDSGRCPPPQLYIAYAGKALIRRRYTPSPDFFRDNSRAGAFVSFCLVAKLRPRGKSRPDETSSGDVGLTTRSCESFGIFVHIPPFAYLISGISQKFLFGSIYRT